MDEPLLLAVPLLVLVVPLPLLVVMLTLLVVMPPLLVVILPLWWCWYRCWQLQIPQYNMSIMLTLFFVLTIILMIQLVEARRRENTEKSLCMMYKDMNGCSSPRHKYLIGCLKETISK